MLSRLIAFFKKSTTSRLSDDYARNRRPGESLFDYLKREEIERHARINCF